MANARKIFVGFLSIMLPLLVALAPVLSTGAAAQTGGGKAYLIVEGGSGTGLYENGQLVQISAVAPPPGKVFSHWSSSSAALSDPNNPTTQVAMPDSGVDTIVTARFKPAARRSTSSSTSTAGPSVGQARSSAAPAAITQVSPAPSSQVSQPLAAPKALPAPNNLPPAGSPAPLTLPATATPVPGALGTDALRTAVTVTGGIGSGSYVSGTAVTVAANAAPAGKVFDRWTGDVGALADASQATSVLTIPKAASGGVAERRNGSPHLVAAISIAATYKSAPVTTAVTVTGGIGSGSYVPGAAVTITASAAPAGKVFNRWTGDVAALASDVAASTVLTVPATPVSLTATYKTPVTGAINLTVQGGTGSGNYRSGQKVTIAANAPAPGKKFASWSASAGVFQDPRASTTLFTIPTLATGVTELSVTAAYQLANSASGGVALTSHRNGGPVDTMGETVFGTVAAADQAYALTATVAPSGRTVPLDFDAATGLFALRLFEGDAPVGAAVTLKISRVGLNGATSEDNFTLTGAAKPAGIQQVLGRLTYGATPALLNEVRTKSYTAWVNEQLQPNTIADTSLEQMNPDGLVQTSQQYYTLQHSITGWRLAYAAYSQRQLREVMTTFWKNHFWSSEKDDNAELAGVYEVASFRSLAFGNFRELLRVSAHSPMMMFFLDNDRSVAGNINENYARELMELHTVGVDGGYGNEDVKAVARILTGWGAEQTSADRVLPVTHRFVFRDASHDTGNKLVPFLNTTFTYKSGPNGVNEGEQLMDILAMHPSTQRFVCGKLVEALVSDSKPASFINTCVAAWAANNGNIGQVLRAILLDPTYLTAVDFQRSKVKSPLESMTGYIRNFGIYPVAGRESAFYLTISQGLDNAGMDMEQFGVPTGFREDRDGWANTASFVQKFRSLTSLTTYWASATNTNKHVNANFTELAKSAGMTTAQSAAAYLLALGTSDRYRQDEYDMVVDALRSTDGFDIKNANAEARLRKAVGLIVTLPSYQLQ
jgi:uncharacterized protein (DUF1800 family)